MFYRTPPGCSVDPADAPADDADELVAIETSIESAITRASELPPERGVALKRCDVTALPVYTFPEMNRKRVLVSTLFEVQVDGDEDAVLATLTELAEALERARNLMQ